MNAGLGNLGVPSCSWSCHWSSRRVLGPAGFRCGCRTPASSVPFIGAVGIGAVVRHEDLAAAQASFADQAVIFMRKHNWLMCWLYLGTLAAHLSAGLPPLIKSQFPAINALQYAWSARWSGR